MSESPKPPLQSPAKTFNDIVLRELNASMDAALAVDDSGVELAALLSERLGLPGNSADAASPG